VTRDISARYPFVQFGQYCVISEDVVIGAGSRVGSFVELRAGTRIGRDSVIDSYVVTSGDCTIGDRVTLRYGTVIARGCVIADDCYLAVRVMTNNLDHHRNAIGGARVGAGCFIGTHAVLAAGIVVAPNTVVGAGAIVTRHLAVPGTYVGIPARMIGPCVRKGERP
jgi:acetyltransferase-like isoleucine patch superfamily enzyme